ncbi:MAG: ribosome maturation factor RimP [Oscillospiraceae bacterium]|nr:ribosome maturation factor RimP [Oscillospiraceae bacterium]
MSKIVNTVTELAEPIARKHGLDIWDVEYIKEAGNWFLRVYIDSEKGVAIADCEAVSRELDPLLDEYDDLFPQGYTFEVSSAGAERRLRRPADFQRYIGHFVEVKLYKSKDGQKVFMGNLSAYTDDGTVELDVSGQKQSFEKTEIAQVRLRIS